MLVSRTFELGPFNIPVWLAAAIGGYLVALIVQRLLFRAHRAETDAANDGLTTVALVTLLVWKLFPLLTRSREIAAAPARLLYYPGGAGGIVAGLALGLGVAVLGYLRRRRRGHALPPPLRVARAALVTLGFILVPVGVVAAIPVEARSTLPDVTLERFDAGTPDAASVSLAGDGASPTVLVFWATWCGPCTAQMPELERFYEQSGSRVRLYAINLATTERSGAVATYIEQNDYAMPILLDNTDAARRAADVRATPTTVIYDRDGAERSRRTGAVTAAWIERRVLPLLR